MPLNISQTHRGNGRTQSETVVGFDALIGNLDAINAYLKSGRAQEVTMNALNRVGADIASTAQRLAPVRTGALRAAIGSQQVGDGRVEVRSGVLYSLFVEFGTARMAANPFFRSAFSRNNVFGAVAAAHRVEIERILR